MEHRKQVEAVQMGIQMSALESLRRVEAMETLQLPWMAIRMREQGWKIASECITELLTCQ